jgi:hypothetical protein
LHAITDRSTVRELASVKSRFSDIPEPLYIIFVEAISLVKVPYIQSIRCV